MNNNINAILASIIELSDDAIIGKDLNGTIFSWNHGAEKLYGYSAAEAIGKSIHFLFPPELESEFNTIMRSIQKGKRIQYDTTKRLCKNGNLVLVHLIVSPIKNSKGKVIGAATMARDITNQKYLESELNAKNVKLEQQAVIVQEASRLKNEFLANMSHELRTPLNVIIGFAKIMYNGMAGPIPEEHKNYLADIIANSNQLLNLIADILDLAKIESGKMEFHFKLTNVHEVMHEIENNFYVLAAKKDIHIDTNIAVDNILMDGDRFKQIMNNYISNAIKFTQDGGQIHIRIYYYQNDTFRLEVEDTGIGIHKEDLSRLFVQFQQLDSSMAKENQGTGLGLALTRHLVEAQGGQVGVSSIFGKGSVFYADLPCHPYTKSPVNTIKKEKDSELVPNIHRILIIEHESQARFILVNALIKAGYVVETAIDLPEAVQRNYQHQFDAIIVDLFLPNMNDWSILRKLHTKNMKKKIPSLVTAIVTENEIEFCYKIHDFLIKPVLSEDLLSALKWTGMTKKNIKSVLIVDNDQDAVDRIKQILHEFGHQAILATNMKEALQTVEKKHPDVIVLDPLMLGEEGFHFLHSLNKSEKGKYTPVIILTRRNLSEEEHNKLKHFIQRIVLKGKSSMQNLLDELRPAHSTRNKGNIDRDKKEKKHQRSN